MKFTFRKSVSFSRSAKTTRGPERLRFAFQLGNPGIGIFKYTQWFNSRVLDILSLSN